MSGCPCDLVVFPPALTIGAGLSAFPRQLAQFPEWRQAMLAAIRRQPALLDWRARASVDLGVMWLEMAAYVFDVISFYDETFAHEAYVRSAVLPESLRGLIALLGYVPRPAVAAVVELAALADGRKEVTLPAGTAFRSGAFSGNPPQVFELTAAAVVHPFFNEWKFLPVRSSFLPSGSKDFILAKTGSVAVKKGDVALFSTANLTAAAVNIDSVAPFTGADGESYSKILFDRTISVAGGTTVSSARLRKPLLTAGLFTLPSDSGDPVDILYDVANVDGDIVVQDSWHRLVLDGVYRALRTGQFLFVSREDEFRWFKVRRAYETTWRVGSEVTVTIDNSDGSSSTVTSDAPPPAVPVTIVELDSLLTNVSRSNKPGEAADWSTAAPEEFTIHFSLMSAADITVEAGTELAANDPLAVSTPLELPTSPPPPGQFQLQDLNGDGVQVSATLNFQAGSFALSQGTSWTPPLRVPVKLHGNLITAQRGETVASETLGSGDAAQLNQVFELKKRPLTFISSPTAGNDNGVASTLRVWVDGIEWRETASFFGAGSEDEIFIARLDEEGKASVIFGDGLRGRRLRTGALVTASYRFGAGAAAPPAGSITQIAKSAPGLKAVRNPVAAYGGADAEPQEEVRRYGPASSLLLGRAISIVDLEAAAAREPGVVAAKATWRWHETKQRPVAQIYYIGDPGLESQLLAKLQSLTEPYTPIVVTMAEAVERELSISIAVDARYLDETVLAGVRTALLDSTEGLLAAAQIGIGAALFRSRIYERVLSIEGTLSVTSLLIDGLAFPGAGAVPGQEYGITAGTGRYFDFAAGGLILNGGVE